MKTSFIMRNKENRSLKNYTLTGGNREAARAVGRCFGALFFSIFGGLWLLLSAYAFGRLDRLRIGLIAGAVLLFVATAVRLQRRGKEAGTGAFPEEQQKRDDRLFGIVNAVQGLAIFLDLSLLPKTRYGQFSFSIAALIVGLHFFALPPLYRHRANLITGALLTIWAIACALLFRGDAMIAWTALGAGVILWGSSAWALMTASRLLRRAGL
ncbi:MAG TPA: hypothetical protein VFC29_10705 [Candidatus Limnocylindrales bacterium]|jgi:hypothetical protein|nr:hypothetical protein [Candidatus Limnocylindrales bacterium]